MTKIISAFLVSSLSLSSCAELSVNELRDSFPEGLRSSEILFAKREYFVCALAAIEGNSDKTIEKPPVAFTEWESLPIDGKVNETSIIYRILDSADNCWIDAAVSRTGAASVWSYADGMTGYFAHRGGVLLLFDARSNTYLVLEV